MRGAISGSNKHQLFVELVDQRGEVERLEEMIADAGMAAREAVELLPTLDYEEFKPNQSEAKYLADAVEKHRILSGDFRTRIGLILHNLTRAQPSSDGGELRAGIIDRLVTARRLSYRVVDLLNAEKEINRQRSHGL